MGIVFWEMTVLLKDCGDWRTLVLLGGCHGFIGFLLFGPLSLPEWVSILFLTPLLTLYSSTQHEILHGHPFKNQKLNDALVVLPWALFVPYFRFKDTHLAHHLDVNLCDPYDDPESWYQCKADWEQRSQLSKAIFNFNNTLIGRMVLGPLIGMTGFVKCDWYHFRQGEWHIALKWISHALLAAVLAYAIASFGNLSTLSYVAVCYLSTSLLMVRTFLEHQAHEKVRGRSVIIENGGFFGFLFLNNSYHAVHHAFPNKAWYRLPEFYRSRRAHFLKMNEGYSFSSYREVFRRFSFKKKEPVPLPVDLNKDR